MKTQEDRLRYILNGGKLRNRESGNIVGLKDGMIWDFTDDRGSSYIFNVNEWEPYIEPLRMEFECKWTKPDSTTYPTCIIYTARDGRFLEDMVGNGRFKVTCEQIIEESK